MQVQDADIRLLRIFDVIVSAGGFSAAQSVLNISASTISGHMTRLETRLGLTLCERGRSGFKLTLAGEHTHEASKKLFDSIDGFCHRIGELHSDLRGELRIGVIDNTVSDMEMPLIDTLRELLGTSYAVTPSIKVGTPYQLEQDVLNGKLHLAIGPFQQHIAGVNYRPLYVEQHCLYCSVHHPFYDRGELSSEMLNQTAVISRIYLFGRDLAVLGVKQAAASIDNVEAQATLIHTGHYIGFLPKHYAQQWVEKGVFKRITSYELGSQFYCITKSGGVLNSLPQAFLDTLDSLKNGVK